MGDDQLRYRLQYPQDYTADIFVKDLDKWQMEKRIVQYPSLLEFLGYA